MELTLVRLGPPSGEFILRERRGRTHLCGIGRDGLLACWGSDASG